MYLDILKRLNILVENGVLTSFTKEVLRDLTKQVANGLAKNYEHVKEGIGDIMGGNVLDLEAIRIRNEGRNEGWNEGRNEGRKESNKKIILIKQAGSDGNFFNKY